MPADSFAANFLKGRLEPTILYMGHWGPVNWEGGVVFPATGGMATNGDHCIIIKTHPACITGQSSWQHCGQEEVESDVGLHSRHAELRQREEWECWISKTAWKPGRGRKWVYGCGEREGSGNRLGKMCGTMLRHSFHQLLMNAVLAALLFKATYLIGAWGRSTSPEFSKPQFRTQRGSKDKVRFLNWISLLCFAALWTMCPVMQDTSHWEKQEQVVLVWN